MNGKRLVFVSVLLLPSVVTVALKSVATTHDVGIFLSITDLAAITLLPFIAGLFFEVRASYLLTGSLSSLLVLTKSLYFDGAERVVVVALVLFAFGSVVSCTLAVVSKYLYQKLRSHSSGVAR